MKDNQTAFVLAEDRPDFELGLRLALASLSRHAPNSLIRCHAHWANENFRNWSRQFPNIELLVEKPGGGIGWNCKPHAMIPLIESGFEEVVWVDSDILVTRDPIAVFRKFADDKLITAEEPTKPYAVPNSEEQAKAWGWQPGIKRLNHVNSCIIRSRPCHLELLQAWALAMADPRYLEEQKKPFCSRQRLAHMMGDQDVLFSLLGSEKFSYVSLETLKIGHDILHCGTASTYSIQRRLCSVFRPCPTFLHAIAGKPGWIFSDLYPTVHSPWQTWIHRLQQEISPYVCQSRQYSHLIGLPIPWLNKRTILGSMFHLLGLGNHALTGFPLVLASYLRKNKHPD